MIETERLIVRRSREGDRAEYLASCNTEAVTAHLGGPASAEEVDAALDRIRKSQEEHGFCLWAVERKSDGRFLGCCGLKTTNLPGTPVEDDIEIGWRFREDAWKQGYASEAAEAVLAWAWERLDVERIVSFTVPANEASWRVMERIGMTRRPDLDFGHPGFPSGHPLSAHVAYVAERPSPLTIIKPRFP
jgi:RimJ/RimL family protein N-acetyltransferase